MIETAADVAHLRLAVNRLLASATFHKSSRLRQLLSYLCEQECTGKSGELRETEIGRHVFGRSEDFDPAADSIVRASMRQLRAKLAEYYSTEGALDEWRVEIPKGAYVPVLVPVIREAAPLDTVAVLAPASPPAAVLPSRHWPRLAAVALAVLLLAAAYLLGRASAPATISPGPAVAPGADSLMEHFLSSTEGPVRLVPSDSVVNIVRSFSGQPLTLENYVSGEFFSHDNPAARANPRHWQAMVSRELMNIGDASVVLRAARQFPKHAARLSFLQARELNARTLKEGNFVFLGSVTANPWLALFDDILTVRHRPYPKDATMRWHNVALGPDEAEWYPSGIFPPVQNRSVSYAHVAILPNLARSGKVLIVAGSSVFDTEAAGEFALSPGSGSMLASALQRNALAESPYFEAILETRKSGGVWSVHRVALAHRLERPRPASQE